MCTHNSRPCATTAMYHYRFLKVLLLETESEQANVAVSLMNYKVCLIHYSESLEQPEIRV